MKIHPDVTALPFEDHLVILTPSSDKLLVINPTARLIWEWLEEGLSSEQLSERLCRTFDIPLTTASSDISAITTQWQELGLSDQATEISSAADDPTQASPKSPPCTPVIEKIFRMAGVDFRIRYHDEQIGVSSRLLFSHYEHPEGEPQHTIDLFSKEDLHYLYKDDEFRFADSELQELKGMLYQEILEICYPETEWLAIAHAAGVSIDRQAAVMPAPSGSGKSTLTAALIQSGLSYHGDDVLPLRRLDQQITPVPTTLSIKSGSWDALSHLYPQLNSLPAYEFFGRTMRFVEPDNSIDQPMVPVPPKCLIYPRYDAAAETGLREIEPTESLQRIIDSGIWLGHPLEPARVSEFLEWIKQTPAYTIQYNNTETAVGWVKELLSR
ncbi:MAG: PqqD family peptide modification chaperone [Candidatus Sedimenticola sp. 20ELBAFRAG]